MPGFSVTSTILQCQRTIDIKEIPHDMKVDDIYIDAADGEEYRPPPKDCWGRERRINHPAVLAKKAQKQIENMIKYEMTGRYSSLTAMVGSEKGKKKGGPGSTLSRKSSLAGKSSLSISAERRAEREENSGGRQAASPGLRKPKGRSDSEKQRAMEKKLLLYYQSLVKPVDEWVRDVDPEQKMIDGSDVDANISKKRAHKKILAENDAAQRKRAQKRKRGANRAARENNSMMSDAKSKDKSHGEGPGGSALGDMDELTSGYIIEDGNLIPID